ncbi:MAG: hypothetical protein A2928_02935 [Candidatus Taylorbacteria bacterium RIFCSPLOWO2_01_FULL_45_15b]|uniref:Uncharacterized protein n=1 Tax=Candidatus Taylorbacteria bacterium RIFCSPLOWO2_01_FULL_45_15b TaxID=1802319 RepID=A0A1G2NC72_9BACT|nr:MAG: hypothetical protein A2928_02935 [Candidatus Taylorbacteria bacterium RIFCSPLOWO2_01_FULL_45_15b]
MSAKSIRRRIRRVLSVERAMLLGATLNQVVGTMLPPMPHRPCFSDGEAGSLVFRHQQFTFDGLLLELNLRDFLHVLYCEYCRLELASEEESLVYTAPVVEMFWDIIQIEDAKRLSERIALALS